MAEKNGFNVDEFQAMVAAVQQEPEAGKLTFRASYAWKDGFAGDTRLETIEQRGQPILTLPGDHPRLSFVSLLSNSGVPIEDIAHLVGHASTNVTEKFYRKELRPVLSRGATAMDALFGGRRAGRSD